MKFAERKEGYNQKAAGAQIRLPLKKSRYQKHSQAPKATERLTSQEVVQNVFQPLKKL